MKKLLLTGVLLAMTAVPALAESNAPDFGTGNVHGSASAQSESYAARADDYGSGGAYGAGGYASGYGYGDQGGYGGGYAMGGRGDDRGGYGDYASADSGYGRGGYDSYAMAGEGSGRCWVSTSGTRAFGYYGSCASRNVDTDAGLLGQAVPNKSVERP